MSVIDNTQSLEELLDLVEALPEADNGGVKYDAVLEVGNYALTDATANYSLHPTDSDNAYDLVTKIRNGEQVKIAVRGERTFISSSTGYIQSEVISAVVVEDINALVLTFEIFGNWSLEETDMVQLYIDIDDNYQMLMPREAIVSRKLSYDAKITIRSDLHPEQAFSDFDNVSNCSFDGFALYRVWYNLKYMYTPSVVLIELQTTLMSSSTISPSQIIPNVYTVDYVENHNLVVSFMTGNFSPFNSFVEMVFVINEVSKTASLSHVSIDKAQLESDGVYCNAVIRFNSSEYYSYESAIPSQFSFSVPEIYNLYNNNLNSNYNVANVVLRSYAQLDSGSSRYYSQLQAISITRHYNNMLVITFPKFYYDGSINGMLTLSFKVNSETSVTLEKVTTKNFNFQSN